MASIQQSGECGGIAGLRKRRQAARAPDAAGTCTQSALSHALTCWTYPAARSEAVGAAWLGGAAGSPAAASPPSSRARTAKDARSFISLQQDAMPAGRGPDKAAEEQEADCGGCKASNPAVAHESSTEAPAGCQACQAQACTPVRYLTALLCIHCCTLTDVHCCTDPSPSQLLADEAAAA